MLFYFSRTGCSVGGAVASFGWVAFGSFELSSYEASLFAAGLVSDAAFYGAFGSVGLASALFSGGLIEATVLESLACD